MNRIEYAIQAMDKQIKERIAAGLTTAAKVKSTGKELDMEPLEYVRFQEYKSLAVADGTLTLEEGMTIYSKLGTTPSTFNKQSVAVKAVLTSLFAQLLQRHLNA